MNLPAFDYESAKQRVRDENPAIRMEIAVSPSAPAELLYFLAKDASMEVRRAVAENPATPRQADQLLAKDPDYGVRCALARKIVGSGLAEDKRDELWRMWFTILEALATDKVVKVRQTLAGRIKSLATAPRDIVLRLARDDDPSVSSAVLQHSPVLEESDLQEIVDGDARGWKREAIGRRSKVPQRLADSIAGYGDTDAVAGLLENDGADISDGALDSIVERAPSVPEWHKPLVRRPSLPKRLFAKIAGFVSPQLREEMARRNGAVSPTVAAPATANKSVRTAPASFQESAVRVDKSRPALSGPPDWAKGTPAERSARTWSTDTAKAFALDPKRMSEDEIQAAIMSGDRDVVAQALAHRAGLGIGTVQRILSSASGKAVTALCWKGGFKMRFALDVQRRIARVPNRSVLNARDGIDFPLSPIEMEIQLELFA